MNVTKNGAKIHSGTSSGRGIGPTLTSSAFLGVDGGKSRDMDIVVMLGEHDGKVVGQDECR